jgi:hypothetical protein
LYYQNVFNRKNPKWKMIGETVAERKALVYADGGKKGGMAREGLLPGSPSVHEMNRMDI